MESQDSKGGGGGGQKRALPYNDEDWGKRPLTAVEDIIKFDQQLQEVTAGLPKPISLGSILRLSEISLANWGIEVNDGNREKLAAIANADYANDAIEYSNNTDANTLHLFRNHLARTIGGEVTTYVSNLAKELLLALDDGRRRFAICNISAGSGGLCTALAASLRAETETERILGRIAFHLVDSGQKLELAVRNLSSYGVKVIQHPMADEKFLEKHIQGDMDKFDLVLLSGHTHHKPFITGHLANILATIKQNGALISGDWHSPILHYPTLVYDLLSELGVDREKLSLFVELLGPFIYDKDVKAYDRLEPEQRQSFGNHMQYWRQLNNEIGTQRYGNARVRILNAMTTSGHLVERFKAAGFETDREKIALAFPGARLASRLPIRLKDRSDSAAVIVGLKR